MSANHNICEYNDYSAIVVLTNEDRAFGSPVAVRVWFPRASRRIQGSINRPSCVTNRSAYLGSIKCLLADQATLRLWLTIWDCLADGDSAGDVILRIFEISAVAMLTLRCLSVALRRLVAG